MTRPASISFPPPPPPLTTIQLLACWVSLMEDCLRQLEVYVEVPTTESAAADRVADGAGGDSCLGQDNGKTSGHLLGVPSA